MMSLFGCDCWRPCSVWFKRNSYPVEVYTPSNSAATAMFGESTSPVGGVCVEEIIQSRR
jgi:hypothetical protein